MDAESACFEVGLGGEEEEHDGVVFQTQVVTILDSIIALRPLWDK